MAWVCVGISSNNTIGGGSSRVIRIPIEFHEHIWWQKLLWTRQEEVANIMKLSGVVLEFEDFREGFFSSVTNCQLELSNYVNEARCVW
jgi:hypothetical protein